MSTPTPELTQRLLAAFAGSDLAALTALSAPELVVFGTDADEHWNDRDELLVALEAMRALGLTARWREHPVHGDGWAAGTAEYAFSDGATATVRVSFSFSAGRLVHAHFSIARPPVS